MRHSGWTLACGALALALAVGTAPAQAAVTVLTFDGFACTDVDGGLTNQQCATGGQWIGADYGSSANLAVSYDASESSGSRTSLQYTTAGYFTGNSGKAYSFPPGPASELSAITFTPVAGHEISFLSYAWDKITATTSGNFVFKVLDPLGNEIHNVGIGGPHVVNSAYYAGPVTFLFGNGGQGAAAVDNVTVDVRPSAITAVPEPATWGLMIAGFSLAGGAMRSKRMRLTAA